jgi:hypothetical protein
MSSSSPTIGSQGSGVKIQDLLDAREFLSRQEKEAGVRARVARAGAPDLCLAEQPGAVLQELVQIAVDFCHADSSGISLEEENQRGELQFRWIAVAGSFALYLNGTTPRFYSPCGTCLDRSVPQLYQVTDPYYNFLGVTARPILDGILIPWRAPKSQSTIWLVSHRSVNAFDISDYKLMQTLADFLSTAIRNVPAPI